MSGSRLSSRAPSAPRMEIDSTGGSSTCVRGIRPPSGCLLRSLSHQDGRRVNLRAAERRRRAGVVGSEGMVWYGWIGLAVLLVDQALLPVQILPLARWFTPVMWTAYVLLADAVVLHRRGRSLIHDAPREAAWMATLSIPLWVVFELYNWRL